MPKHPACCTQAELRSGRQSPQLHLTSAASSLAAWAFRKMPERIKPRLESCSVQRERDLSTCPNIRGRKSIYSPARINPFDFHQTLRVSNSTLWTLDHFFYLCSSSHLNNNIESNPLGGERTQGGLVSELTVDVEDGGPAWVLNQDPGQWHGYHSTSIGAWNAHVLHQTRSFNDDLNQSNSSKTDWNVGKRHQFVHQRETYLPQNEMVARRLLSSGGAHLLQIPWQAG